MKKQKKVKSKQKKRHAPVWKKAADLGLYDPEADKKLAKVRITTYIDSDILNFLKKKSAQSAEGYQTLLNKILRDSMGSTPQISVQEQIEELRKLITNNNMPSNMNLTLNVHNPIIVAENADTTNESSENQLINIERRMQ